MSRRDALVLAAVLALGAAGCGQNHALQSKLRPQAPNAFWPDGKAMREPPEGTVARGHLKVDAHRFAGRENGAFARTLPFPLTAAVMERGRERYAIHCAPCHGLDGRGEGPVVVHGFPRPASFLDDRLRAEPPGYVFDAITRGFGRMLDMASQVPVDDRWAIAAYVAALQLAGHARLEDMPPDARARVQGGR